jgi:hypothetical protein
MTGAPAAERRSASDAGSVAVHGLLYLAGVLQYARYYGANGMLHDERGVVDHMLYWMAPASEAEARYLIVTLNSETARARGEQYQPRGQFGARHFDKVIFNLHIPRFDARKNLHRDPAEATAKAEKIAALVTLPENVKFQRAPGLVRAALAESGVAGKIDELVARLLDGA